MHRRSGNPRPVDFARTTDSKRDSKRIITGGDRVIGRKWCCRGQKIAIKECRCRAFNLRVEISTVCPGTACHLPLCRRNPLRGDSCVYFHENPRRRISREGAATAVQLQSRRPSSGTSSNGLDRKCSLGEVCRRLQSSGKITATGKRVWSRQTVWHILQNPVYQGATMSAVLKCVARQHFI